MSFYFVLIFLLLILLYFSDEKYKGSSFFIILFYFTVFIVAALRGDVGQDTFSYNIHYNSLTDFSRFLFIIKNKEPFLYLIMYPHKLAFDSYTGFLVIISFLQTFLLYYATRKMSHKSIFLIFYILIFYLEFHFNVIRASLAGLFFLCALSVASSNKNKSIVFFILALLSHLSIFILLPVLLLKFRIKVKYLFFISAGLTLFFLPFFFIFSDIILLKIDAYSIFDGSGFRFPVVVSTIVLLVWFFNSMAKNLPSYFLVSVLIFSCFFFLSSFLDIAYRFYMLAALSTLYLAFEDKLIDFSKFKLRPHSIGVLIIGVWLSLNVLYNVVSEKDRVITSGRGNSDFTYIPYSLFFNSGYR